METMLFLVKGQVLTFGDTTIKIVDINESNQVFLDMTCQWKYSDTLAHRETIAEGSSLVFDVSSNYLAIKALSVIKSAGFAFVNIALQFTKNEENLQLVIPQPLFLKKTSTASITYVCPAGYTLVIKKPSGVSITDTPNTNGTHVFTMMPTQFDEIGIYTCTISSSGSSYAVVEHFHVIDAPVGQTHATDIAFKSLSYQDQTSLAAWVQTYSEKLHAEMAELFSHFTGAQYVGSSIVQTESGFTYRILSILGSNSDSEIMRDAIICALSEVNLGTSVGYITTTLSSGSQNKVSFSTQDVLDIEKAVVKTKYDRMIGTIVSTDNIRAVGVEEKKKYAEIFPQASVNSINTAINSIDSELSSSDDIMIMVTNSKNLMIPAIRTFEDSATTQYTPSEVPLELVDTNVTTDIPGTVTKQTVGTVSQPSGLGSISLPSLPTKDFIMQNWKYVAMFVGVLAIIVYMKVKKRKGGSKSNTIPTVKGEGQ